MSILEPTFEQLKRRELAVKNIEQGLPQDTGIIDASTLQPQTDFTPEPTPSLTIPTIPELPEIPKIEATKKETDVSASLKRIMELQGVTGEEDIFRKAQEARPELEAIRKTETDLTSQLKQIIAEQKQLELTAQTIPNIMQQQAKGRGITAAGLAPLTASELRKNQIQQLTVSQKALSVSAMLDATQGNLASALDKIDRATEAKFGARKAELDTELRNLELVSQMPDLTAKEKQQIEDRKLLIAERNQIAEDERIDDKRKGEIAIEAASKNVDSLTLRRIQNAENSDEALVIATEAGVFKEKITPEAIITPTPEKPLTINQIEQFRRSYGWTPPFGFTINQLEQYMADNPDATPEELEAGAKQIAGGEVTKETITQTPDEIITSIMDTISKDQLKSLKKRADEAGISSIWKGKKTDVKNYLNSIKDKIQTALDEGYTQEEILEFLTS